LGEIILVLQTLQDFDRPCGPLRAGFETAEFTPAAILEIPSRETLYNKLGQYELDRA